MISSCQRPKIKDSGSAFLNFAPRRGNSTTLNNSVPLAEKRYAKKVREARKAARNDDHSKVLSGSPKRAMNIYDTCARQNSSAHTKRYIWNVFSVFFFLRTTARHFGFAGRELPTQRTPIPATARPQRRILSKQNISTNGLSCRGP